MKPAIKFLVWKTIKLGTGLKTADDFCKALKDGGFRITDWAKNILKSPDFIAASREIELDLVKVAVRELGFKSGARRNQIYTRIKELGLEICPPEVGPQLRLQYQDQPDGEWIIIAMELIAASSGGGLGVFRVGHVARLWLGGFSGGPACFWGPDCQWVFVRPRK